MTETTAATTPRAIRAMKRIGPRSSQREDGVGEFESGSGDVETDMDGESERNTWERAGEVSPGDHHPDGSSMHSRRRAGAPSAVPFSSQRRSSQSERHRSIVTRKPPGDRRRDASTVTDRGLGPTVSPAGRERVCRGSGGTAGTGGIDTAQTSGRPGASGWFAHSSWPIDASDWAR